MEVVAVVFKPYNIIICADNREVLVCYHLF
jgi:hypothetical protein